MCDCLASRGNGEDVNRGHTLFPTSSELGADQVQVLSQASSSSILLGVLKRHLPPCS